MASPDNGVPPPEGRLDAESLVGLLQQRITKKGAFTLETDPFTPEQLLAGAARVDNATFDGAKYSIGELKFNSKGDFIMALFPLVVAGVSAQPSPQPSTQQSPQPSSQPSPSCNCLTEDSSVRAGGGEHARCRRR